MTFIRSMFTLDTIRNFLLKNIQQGVSDFFVLPSFKWWVLVDDDLE